MNASPGSTSLVPSTSAWSRSNREVARIQSNTELSVVRTAAAAHLETARLDALDHVAGRAMEGVALVSQLEQQLSQVVPIAAGRLQALGDMHALACGQQLSSFTRRLP